MSPRIESNNHNSGNGYQNNEKRPDVQLSASSSMPQQPSIETMDHGNIDYSRGYYNASRRRQRQENVQFSTPLLPAVTIRSRIIVPLLIIVILIFIATVERLRTFVIEERALLTQIGRVRHRTRRRQFRQQQHCDESDEPKRFQVMGWRRLSPCLELDLSLRKRPLGDNGVRRLVGLLSRKEYATHQDRRGQLKVLNLERQGITRQGAGYLARWLSADPIMNAEEEERVPTAASPKLFLNLEGNPIGPQGVKQLERAVVKARLNGIAVVIIGGGSSTDKSGTADHMVKLGPIVYTRKAMTDMPPW
eukprot:CAMPEP_0194203218 /NCGR_PEP_ID=MMETSP0156-20130528/3058_1 /TAXON_ID=33649 /ORGANISM="Thalassionema nitzschioides, Strain L26-B" /LENGTH=304 /DNA_ID=CAMNT_0038928925 /DNA_START=37 /DNA_END=948 /DNA_ORIENTATION=+